MNRQEINLIGGGFQHSPSTSGFEPIYMKWIKGIETALITIYVDEALLRPINNISKKNYGWLCESKTINRNLYEWVKNNINILKDKFILVFTHDVELSKTSDLFALVQCSGKSFIESGEVYPKTKLVSMIASNKMMCGEHAIRHEFIKKYSNKCDHYGRGFNPINNKVDGLKDYCFSFAMENATYSNMFTEKITDCFMTGTIPIYYGIKNIGDFFNSDGIIMLDDDFKIEELTFDLYLSKFEPIKDNYERANKLLVAEDYIYKNYIENEI